MANLSLIRVNQKLAHVSALLDGADVNSLSSLHYSALKESAAFHLVCAYQHYLRELAESYWLKNTSSICNEAELIDAFKAAGKHPAEAEELLALKGSNDSWLNNLHCYYESLWSALMPSVPSTESTSQADVIQAVIIDSNFVPSAVDIGTLLTWKSEFVEVITRHRQTAAEF